MKKFVLILVLALSIQGLRANTCSTATVLTVKDSLVPDTFQFSGTEYWFSITGNQTITFCINNQINSTYAGITQIDLYTGSCTGKQFDLLSITNMDTIAMFKYTLVSGTTYYLKLTRPSGLGTLNFSVLATTFVGAPLNPCSYDNCKYIKNGGFNINQNINMTMFWASTNQFALGYICGWKAGWYTPNIHGNASNPIAYMWSYNDNGGEAIVQDVSQRQLTPGHSYTLAYDYSATGVDGGKINFVLSNLGISNYPLVNDAASLYISGTYAYLLTPQNVTTGQWVHVSTTFTAPQLQQNGFPYLTLVVDPQSNGNSKFEVNIDNISITEHNPLSVTYTSTDATSCSSCDGTIDLTVTNGESPYTYEWTGVNGFTATTQDISNLCAGSYNVTVTDAIGCTWISSYVINTSGYLTGANWPQITNSSGDEEISDITTDIYGNVYAIGWFSNSLTLGQNTYTVQSGSFGIFVVKYDYCGNVEASQYYGRITKNKPDLHIEFFSNRIIVAGEFAYIDFTGGGNVMNTIGGCDIFLASLDCNTLLCNANQQVQIGSTEGDYVKGLSVKSNAVYIAGVFSGSTLHFSNSSTTLSLAGGGGDLFICRFLYTMSSLVWAQNYPDIYYDEGFNLQCISSNYTPFFTYMQNNSNGYPQSYIAKLNSSTGAIISSAQIGTGNNDYFQINDMGNYSNQNCLYLCGYYKISGSNYMQAAIIFYPSPNTNLDWATGTTSVLSYATSGTYGEATKVAVNANGVFVSGTYSFSGFKIGDGTNWSPSISVYGTTNHFVYKTDAVLTSSATNGWLSGVAANTTGTSRGNSLAYDGAHSLYYLGGTFNGYTKLTGTLVQTMTPYTGGYDGFVARFGDNSGADYKSLLFGTDSVSKVVNNKVVIYPNPSNGNFTINSVKDNAITGITVTDITGRTVFKKNYENKILKTSMDLSFLSAGSYLVNVLTDNSNNYNIRIAVIK